MVLGSASLILVLNVVIFTLNYLAASDRTELGPYYWPDEAQLEALREEVKKSRADVEAMRSQAIASAESFSDLLERNAELKRQLNDYDDVFGASRKKQL